MGEVQRGILLMEALVLLLCIVTTDVRCKTCICRGSRKNSMRADSNASWMTQKDRGPCKRDPAHLPCYSGVRDSPLPYAITLENHQMFLQSFNFVNFLIT